MWSDFTSRTKMKEAKTRREMKSEEDWWRSFTKSPGRPPAYQSIRNNRWRRSVGHSKRDRHQWEHWNCTVALYIDRPTDRPASPTASDTDDDYSNDISRKDHFSTSNRNTQQPEPSNSSILVSIVKEKLKIAKETLEIQKQVRKRKNFAC